MKIWKAELGSARSQYALSIPEDAEPLCVQMQHGLPYLWYKCDPDKPRSTLTIRVVPTGEEFDAEGLTYIGTVQDRMGYVWHYWY